MIRYALYTRKSHDDTDVTEKSLTDQLKVWRDLATERGYVIHREYQESKSAKDPGVRPLFKEMIGRIQKGEISGILVWHVNRLAHNMTEGVLLADLLINGKIKEIRTPNEVFQQQDNILPLVLQQATATQNNRDHTEAVLRGVTSRFADGGWTHRAPVGYLNRRDSNNARRGLVIPDPDRFEKLRLAWEMLLTSAHSVEEVIDTLNSRWGFRTRQTKKRGGGPLTRSHGYKMFTDIFYVGYLERQGQIQKGQHKPLVSLKEYHCAQEILHQRGKARSTRSGQSQSHTQWEKHQFPFMGLIRCTYCGQQVTAGLLRKNGRQYTYYRCSNSYKRCTQRGISEAKIMECCSGGSVVGARNLMVVVDALSVSARTNLGSRRPIDVNDWHTRELRSSTARWAARAQLEVGFFGVEGWRDETGVHALVPDAFARSVALPDSQTARRFFVVVAVAPHDVVVVGNVGRLVFQIERKRFAPLRPPDIVANANIAALARRRNLAPIEFGRLHVVESRVVDDVHMV